MFAFDLLRMELAHRVVDGGEVAFIAASSLSVKVDKPKGLEQGVHLLKDRIGPGPQDVGQDHPGEVITRRPQPPLLGLAPAKTPPLIYFRGLHSAYLYRERLGTAPRHDGLVDRVEERGLFFNSSMTVVGLIC